MKKCFYADKYKGLRSPKCNKGKGCEKCREVYKTKSESKRGENL